MIILFVKRNEQRKWCMGIIAEEQNGKIIHGRNLDYDFPEYLQNVTYIAKFYKNDSVCI